VGKGDVELVKFRDSEEEAHQFRCKEILFDGDTGKIISKMVHRLCLRWGGVRSNCCQDGFKGFRFVGFWEAFQFLKSGLDVDKGCKIHCKGFRLG
tara:strand:- start:554 stop:838 length:285 start_codon:yes stop_codon:yes gene_type:complete